ncbi:recombinase family protein [Vibrio bathopelagicus]
MPVKQCVALVRVSSAIQEHGHGLDRQDSEIATFLASSSDYSLTRTISAIGQSAFSGVVHDSTSEFGTWLLTIESNPARAPYALLLPSIDRLTRLPFFEATALVNRILDVVTELVICDTGKVYSKVGGSDLGSILELTMKLQIANEESEQKSKRLRAARERRKTDVANKVKIPNYLPFWITWNGTDYAFNEHVNAVRKMVEMRLNGLGAVSIQSHLNENLHLYPLPQRTSKQANSTKWTKSRIDDILFKEVTITGDYVIKTTHTPEEKRNAKRNNVKLPHYNRALDFVCVGLFPAVVDKVTYSKMKSGTGKGRQSNAHYNVLRGIAKCVCGSSCVLSHDTKKVDLDSRIYLKCNSRNQSGRVSVCRNPSTKLYPLVRAVLNHILHKPLVTATVPVTRVDEIELALLDAQKLQSRLRSILETCEDSELSHYMKRLQESSASVSALELEYQTALSEATNVEDSSVILTNLRKLDLSTADARLAVNVHLRKLLVSLVVDATKPEVTLTFKDGSVMVFNPDLVGDIAETHTLQFEVNREESDDDLSDFD